MASAGALVSKRLCLNVTSPNAAGQSHMASTGALVSKRLCLNVTSPNAGRSKFPARTRWKFGWGANEMNREGIGDNVSIVELAGQPLLCEGSRKGHMRLPCG